MTLKKRLTAAVLAAILTLSLSTGALAANQSTFRDVPASHWANSYVEELAAKELVEGVGEDRFAPEASLTNASFVVMTLRAFSAVLELDPQELETQSSWYQGYLNSARDLGLLSGCSFTDAQAGSPMTRYDMASFISALGNRLGLRADGTGAAGLSDYAAMPADRRQAVDYACALGVLTGYSDGAFHGSDHLTRAQAAAALCRLLEVAPGQPGRRWAVQRDETYTTVYSTPSTKLWTGQRGRTWAFQVSGSSQVASSLAQAMDSYPRTVIFFSSQPLEIRADQLCKPYEITHGLHTCLKAVCNEISVFKPEETGESYYEYRLDLFYSAQGLVRMYREGRLDHLPDYMDGYPQLGEADYTLLLHTVEEIEDTYGLTSASSDYDKALAAYRYLTENCTYDYYMMSQSGNDLVHMFDSVDYPHEINYMLTYHKGVCFEYALTYQALCYVLGLECYVVTGNAGGPHAWNMVQVDGQWYQADATWDAGDSTYSYFLVSDQTMRSRTIDPGYYDYPACPSDYPQ